MASATLECYSCGSEDIDPESARNFCRECEKLFSEGTERQKQVEERAAALEVAKSDNDISTIKEIMGEIFAESYEVNGITETEQN